MGRQRRAVRQEFNVLIATDGSPSARAALATALTFPWPPSPRVRGVVVSSFDWIGSRSSEVRRLFNVTFQGIAESARRSLAARWPAAEVTIVHGKPAAMIVGEARRHRANVIVIGWRGYGSFRRFLMGSVSRQVVERAPRAVLVVRRPAPEIGHIVLGVDGSPNARRAVAMVAQFLSDGKVATVVRAVEPKSMPTAGRLTGPLRSVVQTEVAALNERLVQQARRDVESAVARLTRAGWTVQSEICIGAPLVSLLDVVEHTGAQLLVIGARATSGLARALLGSVATGALNRSPVPVLVVR